MKGLWHHGFLRLFFLDTQRCHPLVLSAIRHLPYMLLMAWHLG
jgi:hypothetical protein